MFQGTHVKNGESSVTITKEEMFLNLHADDVNNAYII